MYKLEQKINSEYDDMGMEELTEAIMPPGKEMTPEDHKRLKLNIVTVKCVKL